MSRRVTRWLLTAALAGGALLSGAWLLLRRDSLRHVEQLSGFEFPSECGWVELESTPLPLQSETTRGRCRLAPEEAAGYLATHPALRRDGDRFTARGDSIRQGTSSAWSVSLDPASGELTIEASTFW